MKLQRRTLYPMPIAFILLSLVVGIAAQPVPPDTVITLQRGGCRGTCPIYKLTITADGSVLFEGEWFVDADGQHRKHVDHEVIENIVAEFEKRDFFSLKDSYTDEEGGCSTDSSTAITSITINGKSKSVTHYHGCYAWPSAELTDLENKIDSLVDTTAWTRYNEAKEGRIQAVEKLAAPCSPVARCEEDARRLARDTLVLFRYTDHGSYESHSLVICRDGFLHLTDSRLRFVSEHGFQARLSAAQLRRVRALVRALRSLPPQDRRKVALAPWMSKQSYYDLSFSIGDTLAPLVHGAYYTMRDSVEVYQPLVNELHKYLDEAAFISRAKKIRIKPIRARLRHPLWDGQIESWPTDTQLQISRIGQRPLTHREWENVARQIEFSRGGGFKDQRFLDGAQLGMAGPAALLVLLDVDSPRWICSKTIGKE